MKLNRGIFLLILLFLCPALLRAQASIRDSSIFITEVKMSYAFQVPGGDLADRFGANSNIGLDVNFKLPNHLNFGIQGSFLFGNQLKNTDFLNPLKNSDGEIMDMNGEYAIVLVFERGFTINGTFGYLLPKFGPNPNSGILFQVGIGMLQHKVRIEADRNPVPQLQDDYKKGYDRLSNGILFNQFIGYKYLSNKRMINFFAGIEFNQAITQCRRSFNFDEVKREEGTRLDLLYGIRVGWILPLYQRAAKDIYFIY